VCCVSQGGEKQGKVSKLVKNEVLMLNIGSMCTGACVIAVRFQNLCSCMHTPIIKHFTELRGILPAWPS
jgi:translation initiation factor 2 gamma subunit (eIF-2gamma)